MGAEAVSKHTVLCRRNYSGIVRSSRRAESEFLLLAWGGIAIGKSDARGIFAILVLVAGFLSLDTQGADFEFVPDRIRSRLPHF